MLTASSVDRVSRDSSVMEILYLKQKCELESYTGMFIVAV